MIPQIAACGVMSTSEFIGELANIALVPPAELSLETLLDSLEMWDSMAQVATIAMVDEALGARLPPGGLGACKTVGDIVNLVRDKLKD
jgi:acyl carrier protein